jgi:hypothetical protein
MWPRPWSSSVLREILPFSQTIVGMIAGCRSNTGGIIATRVHKHEREAVAQRVQCTPFLIPAASAASGGESVTAVLSKARSGKAQSNQARDQAAQSSSQSERGRTGWSAAMAGLLVSRPIPWAGVSSCLTSAARRGDTGSAIASYSTRSRRPIASSHAL